MSAAAVWHHVNRNRGSGGPGPPGPPRKPSEPQIGYNWWREILIVTVLFVIVPTIAVVVAWSWTKCILTVAFLEIALGIPVIVTLGKTIGEQLKAEREIAIREASND